MNPFANSILILGTLARLTFIASAAEEQPSVGNSYRREDSAIEPGSVISGYPIPLAYTLLRYDEKRDFLAGLR